MLTTSFLLYVGNSGDYGGKGNGKGTGKHVYAAVILGRCNIFVDEKVAFTQCASILLQATAAIMMEKEEVGKALGAQVSIACAAFTLTRSGECVRTHSNMLILLIVCCSCHTFPTDGSGDYSGKGSGKGAGGKFDARGQYLTSFSFQYQQ